MASPQSVEIPSHRACAHCRSQKVRCIPENGNPDLCQRCARSGKSCVFTPLQKRKQRKRTDTRVAELEREMKAMRAALKNAKQQGTTDTQPTETRPPPPSGLWYQENVADAPRVEMSTLPEHAPMKPSAVGVVAPAQAQANGPKTWPQNDFPLNPTNHIKDGKDVVDRGILSMETARQLLNTYRNDLYPHYPCVAIPSYVTADELRHTKPVLFLAIMAAASGKETSDLAAVLDKEILQAYATRSLVQSEKSLAVVQALLISALWYCPPSKYGQLKYYEYINMAVTMAMDLGIGSRPANHRSRFGKERNGSNYPRVHPAEDATNPDLSMTPRSRDSSPDTASIESRRTFLGCYMICAGVSLSLRRPNILKVSSYVRESVEYMERSPQALPNDRMLVAWVKLVMIAEEISNSFAYDDPGGIASITELRVHMMIKDYDKRLADWNNQVAEADMNGSLTIMYYTVRLYLHEVALHVDHSPEDFRAPYQMGVIHSTEGGEIPTQVLATSVAECITNAHELLNAFCSMDVDECRGMPVFSYVRVSFAAFVLAKLSLSAAHPTSQIAKVLDKSSLKVESYMDHAILHVREIVGPLRCRVPAIFLALLFKLRQWCLNPEMIELPQRGIPQALDPREGERQAQQHVQLSSIKHKPRRVIEGPRVTEQGSSSESSPQNLPPKSRHVTFENVTSAAGINGALQASDTYTSSSDITPGSMDSPQYTAVPSTTVPPGVASEPSLQNMYVGPTDQMQLDEDFMQYLGDMSGFSDAGLTDLDQWLPDDMMGFRNVPEEVNWQPTPGPSDVSF